VDGFGYVGMKGNLHHMECLADGGRVVLDVYVDDAPVMTEESGERNAKIYINRAGGGLEDMQVTFGMTHIVTMPEGDGLLRFPCPMCVASYIGPRTATMMARIYLPVNPVVVDVDLSLTVEDDA
jgi:hypothetical protein